MTGQGGEGVEEDVLVMPLRVGAREGEGRVHALQGEDVLRHIRPFIRPGGTQAQEIGQNGRVLEAAEEGLLERPLQGLLGEGGRLQIHATPILCA